MMLLERLVGPLILVVLLGLTALSLRSSSLSRARQRDGLCARCGRLPGHERVSDGESTVTMCDACARTSVRNHLAGYYFFLGAGVLLSTATAYVLALDLTRGHHPSWSSLWLALPVAAPFLIALGIRRRMRISSDSE